MAEINLSKLFEKKNRFGTIFFENSYGFIEAKVCKKCRKTKSIEGFNVSRNGLGGRVSNCKECMNEIYFQFERVKRAAERGVSSENIGKPKYTQETFEKAVKEKFGEDLEVTGNYVNTRTCISVKSSVCGHEFPIKPGDLLRGRGCPQCNGKFKKTTEQFKLEVHKVHGNEFTVLGEYINIKTPILVRHNDESCDFNEFTPLPSNILKGQKCPKCARNIKRTHEEFLKQVFEEVGEEYSVIKGYYLNNKTKLIFRHNSTECNFHEYPVKAVNFLTVGQRCPVCRESKGERLIRKWFEERNIYFVRQYSFDDLSGVGGLPLKFDFAILNTDESVKLLIEFDGIFHYEKQYDGDGFEKIQEHDRRKNEYCKNNKIKLLRIPYTELGNLEEILEGAII